MILSGHSAQSCWTHPKSVGTAFGAVVIFSIPSFWVRLSFHFYARTVNVLRQNGDTRRQIQTQWRWQRYFAICPTYVKVNCPIPSRNPYQYCRESPSPLTADPVRLLVVEGREPTAVWWTSLLLNVSEHRYPYWYSWPADASAARSPPNSNRSFYHLAAGLLLPLHNW